MPTYTSISFLVLALMSCIHVTPFPASSKEAPTRWGCRVRAVRAVLSKQFHLETHWHSF